MNDDNLNNRKIKNYLRKNISNDGNNNNENKIRNKLLSLYYYNINDIPIFKKIEEGDEEYKNSISKFPEYFSLVNRDKIIDIFNKEVSPRKVLRVDYNDEYEYYYNYDIKDNNYLKISPITYRPYYYDDWKEMATKINEVDVNRQHSFYNKYLHYYLRYKKFPDFNEFLEYIYKKNNEKPVHKDIRNVYNNIYNSYKELIINNEYSYDDIRKRIISTTSIKRRKELQS